MKKYLEELLAKIFVCFFNQRPLPSTLVGISPGTRTLPLSSFIGLASILDNLRKEGQEKFRGKKIL